MVSQKAKVYYPTAKELLTIFLPVFRVLLQDLVLTTIANDAKLLALFVCPAAGASSIKLECKGWTLSLPSSENPLSLCYPDRYDMVVVQPRQALDQIVYSGVGMGADQDQVMHFEVLHE